MTRRVSGPEPFVRIPSFTSVDTTPGLASTYVYKDAAVPLRHRVLTRESYKIPSAYLSVRLPCVIQLYWVVPLCPDTTLLSPATLLTSP